MTLVYNSMAVKKLEVTIMHPKWRVNDAKPRTGNARAEKMYPTLGKCSLCFHKAIDRHHMDGNTLNNKETNIAPLCRYHHMIVDGRMDKLIERQKSKVPNKTKRECVICGVFAYPIRKGKCHACNEYFRRNSVERQVKHLDGKVFQRCLECGEWFELVTKYKLYCSICSQTRLLQSHAKAERKRRKLLKEKYEKHPERRSK